MWVLRAELGGPETVTGIAEVLMMMGDIAATLRGKQSRGALTQRATSFPDRYMCRLPPTM